MYVLSRHPVAFSMGSHTGTHRDSPLHFIAEGLGLHEMPLDAVIGRARIIEIHDTESIKRDGVETHLALLEAGIWIIEGLDLSKVAPGIYELVCLPIKVTGSDGGPARAILRKVGGEE